MATADSKQLIETLLKAEKRAEELISEAKKNRVQRLREAKAAADEELKEFKEKSEADFQKTIASKASANPAGDLQESTRKELEMVEQDYQNNKAKTIQYVVSKVLDVPIELSTTQLQALKSGMV
mmetsp:Transcript_794/g.1322  ORF Transcript_794/g.1322 Transcript_794/m.1322 type:complete len:124 (-) Transcript_794:146-517(-)